MCVDRGDWRDCTTDTDNIIMMDNLRDVRLGLFTEKDQIKLISVKVA